MLAAGGLPVIAAAVTPVPGPLPGIVEVQPIRLHNYATSTRWVVLHRGARVLRTMIITPTVTPGVMVPAIEFAHGWNSKPAVYAAMLRAWASAGCVVIAPTSPGMARGRGLINGDGPIAAQTADLPVVLTQALALHLNVVINPAEIALAGHSDGGSSVARMAFNRRLTDPRITAFLIFSAGRDGENSGRRFVRTNARPVFIADSFGDQYGDYPSARAFYREAAGPKILVGIGAGETHLPPWSVATPRHLAIWSAAIDFVRWTCSGAGADRRAMLGVLHRPGLSVNAS
jgi:hypothetical protein